MPFRFLDHTGDTAVEISGRNGSDLFREAASALRAIYVDCEEGEPVVGRFDRSLQLEAEDGECLLVDFLNELIYLFDTERFLSADVEVLDLCVEAPAHLEARLRGETFDPGRHVSLTEVKAATFHGVEVIKTADGFRATVVFDL